MNQDYSKAVSFTNSYFALADGLVSGLENCLADNVLLDWFGKTIKGRTNVAAFMNTHKVNSRHVFDEINPTDKIGYNKKQNRRCRRRVSKIQNNFLNNESTSTENEVSFHSTPENKTVPSCDRSRSSSKIDSVQNSVEESNLTFELHDDDISTLFKLENIKSTNVEEIEQQISRISLENNLKTKTPEKKEYKNLNNFRKGIVESSMKFVEAHGEILFSKKSRRQSGWSDCKLFPSSSTQTWRKPCKLQIAYSSQKICLQQVLSANNNSIQLDGSSDSVESQQKLLSLDEITELSNQLVPNINNFAGYLRNINTAKEEETFFKKFDEFLSKNEANKLGLIPRYINGQLIFQNINCDNEHNSQNSFVFNHVIHLIIYEGRSRCRINLSEKFI